MEIDQNTLVKILVTFLAHFVDFLSGHSMSTNKCRVIMAKKVKEWVGREQKCVGDVDE